MIKFAIATDNSNQQSFYCRDGRFYSLSTNEDIGILDELYTNAYFSLPLIMDGCYLNLKEGVWPDEEFDIILAAVECNLNYLDLLYKLYPSAVIVGQFKETWNHNISIRNSVIQNTTAFATPFLKSNFIDQYGLTTPSHHFRIPVPVDSKYLQNKFYVEKEQKIFDYGNYWAHGRDSSQNIEVLNNINLESIFYQSKDPVDFIKHWARCRFMLNIDKSSQYGLQSIQCSCLDTIMIGGNNDCQQVLFPELTGTDTKILTTKLNDLINDPDLQSVTLNYAAKKYNEYYSFTAVKSAILEMYHKLKS